MKKVLNIVSSLPVAPVFLAWSYALLLYLHNIGELSLSVLFIPLLIIVFVQVSIFIIFRKIFGVHNTIIFLSLFTVIFFSFGDSAAIVSAALGRLSLGNPVTIFLYLLIIFLVVKILPKLNKYVLSIVKYLLVVSVIILVSPIFNIVKYETTQRSSKNVKSQLKIPLISKDLKDKPDIYYIVPDSYSGNPAFKKYIGFDNSNFTDKLADIGFYIADKSTSNYPKTYLSLSSSLNLEYLDYLSVNINSSNETLIDPLIKNNNLVLFLKKIGYSYYQLGSWWRATQYNKLATKNFNLDLINPAGINAFNSIIINNSILKPLLPESLFSSVVTESVDDKRRRIIYQFNTLPEIAKLPGPKFVFAHIIAPHGPNVFGKNCEFISQEELIGVSDETGYTNQVNCINNYLTKTIDEIMKNSVKPPVIIIQSDEGAPFLADRLNPQNNWKTADPEMLKEKFPIFAAFYFPDGKYENLYKNITPVNEFRVILNKYFNTNLPLLPDKNYILLDPEHLYEFKDVTKLIGN
jgi:hypothetical protein